MSDWQRSQLQCRHEGRQNWLHAKKRTLSERQGSGRERRPKWRLFQGSKLSVCMQNDRIFASLVECVLRRSFSEHWQKNGIDPRPTTYQSRRPTRQGQTVDLLSVRVRKRRPKCSLGHFQSELSLEIRLKRKPPPPEKSLSKRNRTTQRFFDEKTSKKRGHTHKHTHTQKISELI